MLLLIAKYNFTRKKFLLQTFPNKSTKIDYQYNNLFCKGSDFFQWKFHVSRRLVPVNGCN